jgi:beta-ureidopropionase / N-carbamoyl-L-amino-acid hydrolase
MEGTFMKNLRINRERFLRTINEMSQIGLLDDATGGGRDRRPFSPADRRARAYFRREAEAADLAVTVDGAANLSARLASANAQAQTLLIGSHLDTVPHGGAYDGALGVLAGLEVLRTLADHQVSPGFHVEVVDFTDEEGRFGNFFGSKAVTGEIGEEEIRAFLQKAADFPEDLAAVREQAPGGLTVESVQQARRLPSTLAGYLELHIEQGPRLEHAGVPIGVVSAIFGRRSFALTLRGRSDHAGTTPLPMRSDALVAAAHFIADADQLVAEHFPQAVVTCGNVTVKPGVYNVVPNEATVWVEFRAATLGELDGIEAGLQGVAQNACVRTHTEQTIQWKASSEPTSMDGDLQGAIRQAAQRCGYGALDLPSGAGHDAQMLAAITPAAMLFVPSHNGRSHSPAEHTDADDLVAGANVLLQAVVGIGGEE